MSLLLFVIEVSDRQPVHPEELVDELNRAVGGQVSFRRNGGQTTTGTLIRAEIRATEFEDRAVPVVHVLMHTPTRDGSTPVMISLVVGVAPDADFFWPDCPIDVSTADGTSGFVLRSRV